MTETRNAPDGGVFKLQRLGTLEVPTPREEIAELLRDAATMVEDGGRDGSAAWRIADALAMLKGQSREALPGVDEPTGMGARLVRE